MLLLCEPHRDSRTNNDASEVTTLQRYTNLFIIIIIIIIIIIWLYTCIILLWQMSKNPNKQTINVMRQRHQVWAFLNIFSQYTAAESHF